MVKFLDPSFSSPANSAEFRDNYDRAFAKKKRCSWHDGDHDPYCANSSFPGYEYCAFHLEKTGITVERPETD